MLLYNDKECNSSFEKRSIMPRDQKFINAIWQDVLGSEKCSSDNERVFQGRANYQNIY